MKIINTIPIIPNIRPAIAIPFDSSAISPIIPNRIAAPGLNTENLGSSQTQLLSLLFLNLCSCNLSVIGFIAGHMD